PLPCRGSALTNCANRACVSHSETQAMQILTLAVFAAMLKIRSRWGRESNPRTRLCRPLPHHSATPPRALRDALPIFEPATPTLARWCSSQLSYIRRTKMSNSMGCSPCVQQIETIPNQNSKAQIRLSDDFYRDRKS